MSLVRFLLNDDGAGISKRTLRTRLRHPWGYPAAAVLRSSVELHAAGPEQRVEAGEALLVSVDADGLWHLAPTRRHVDDLELRGSAAECARLSHRLVTRDLPLYEKLDALHQSTHWHASAFVLPSSAAPPTALDGESYGLSIALATASVALGLPIAGGLVASAALRPDGSLGAVHGLGRKVQLVLEHAPGVTRFLVAAGQEVEAACAREGALRSLGLDPSASWLDIVPVRTFQDAFSVAFPGALESLRQRWRDAAVADRLADELYRTAIYGTPMVLGWSAVATCATELSAASMDDAKRARLEVVRRIARRHAGEGDLLPWPEAAELAALPRALRLRLVAHVVQSAADAGAEPASYAERALALVRPALERAPEDAVLLGAAGRALAAAGDEEAAIGTLRDAVDAWFEVGSPEESSYALCELLRLLGAAGRSDEVLRLCEVHVAAYELDPRAPEVSVGYVRIAAGRALVQAGRPVMALDYLSDDARWPPLPPGAEGARDRWWARALDGAGRRDEADARRHALEACRGRGAAATVQAALAELDRALRDGEGTDAALAELARHPGPRATLACCPAGANPARHLAERTRY